MPQNSENNSNHLEIEEEISEKAKIALIEYDADNYQDKEFENVEDAFKFFHNKSVTWLNIAGLDDVNTIQKIAGHLNIHHLIVEDIIMANQRPKMEDSGEYIFVVMHMLNFDKKNKDLLSEQISFIIGRDYVITFQEKIGDIFNGIKDRIKQSKGRIRKQGADYLAYALIDAIVDRYFVFMEKVEGRIEELEDEITNDAVKRIPQKLHSVRSNIVYVRKQVWPLRELINSLTKSESKIISKVNNVYFHSIYDHTVQIIDTIEMCQDILGGLHDIYLSTVSNRLNEIIKVLTVFTALFIPLTLIAGIYGMNFKYMPGLDWQYGYYFVVGAMAVIFVALLIFFKQKRWF